MGKLWGFGVGDLSLPKVAEAPTGVQLLGRGQSLTAVRDNCIAPCVKQRFTLDAPASLLLVILIHNGNILAF